MAKILVTGCAGFIGFHVTKKLLSEGYQVLGIDSLNEYYDVSLKKNRLKEIKSPLFNFCNIDICDKRDLEKQLHKFKPSKIIHLAAQAGVRYSFENPYSYIDSNISGFLNILELSKTMSIKHLVYASSSSVYGGNTNYPFSERNNVDHPVSLYAATKKSNELMAHTYSHLFSIPTTGLRFFTVYGPWGRPDMSLFIFVKSIIENQPIDVYNHGNMIRDFTYVDDIVEGIIRVLNKPPTIDEAYDSSMPDPSKSSAPYKVFNIGNSNPVKLMDYINAIKTAVGKEPIINMMPLQPGDVIETSADIELINKWVDFVPKTNVEEGIAKFVNWYIDYHKVKI